MNCIFSFYRFQASIKCRKLIKIAVSCLSYLMNYELVVNSLLEIVGTESDSELQLPRERERGVSLGGCIFEEP